jgi:hypothetical protein
MTKSLIQELFTSQISRLYFNCESANKVVAKAEGDAGLTAEERRAIWDEAFSYSDSYWEPVPLMTIDYIPLKTVARNYEPGAVEFINSLIIKIAIGIVLLYAVFCLMVTQGVIIKEREDGLISRLKSTNTGFFSWSVSSILTPAVTYALLLILLFLASGDLLSRAAIPELQTFFNSMPGGNLSRVQSGIQGSLSSMFASGLLVLLFCLVLSTLGYILAMKSKSYLSYRMKVFAVTAGSLLVYFSLVQ